MDSSSLAALSDADRLAYATYRRVRDEVLRMKDRRGRSWREPVRAGTGPKS